ncbi:hypothetical protein GIB67_023251, partial [Kingdonia uniflora]
VFKDGGKEAKEKNPTCSPVKCYFVRTESTASIDEKKPYRLFKKSIYAARCVFMHVHTVPNMAKYMARFSLILSKTIKLEVDLSSVKIEFIEDQACMNEIGNIVYNEDGEALIHTDGTGFISEDLALECPRRKCKGSCSSFELELQRFLYQTELKGKSSELPKSKSHVLEPVRASDAATLLLFTSSHVDKIQFSNTMRLSISSSLTAVAYPISSILQWLCCEGDLSYQQKGSLALSLGCGLGTLFTTYLSIPLGAFRSVLRFRIL